MNFRSINLTLVIFKTHQLRDRISKQIPIEDKVKWADFVINNNSSLEQLKKRTASLYHKLAKKSGRR